MSLETMLAPVGPGSPSGESAGVRPSPDVISTLYVPGKRPCMAGISYLPFEMVAPDFPESETNSMTPSSRGLPFRVILPSIAIFPSDPPQPKVIGSSRHSKQTICKVARCTNIILRFPVYYDDAGVEELQFPICIGRKIASSGEEGIERIKSRRISQGNGWNSKSVASSL